MSRVFVSPLATPFHSLVSIFPIPSRYISIFRAPPPRYFSPSLTIEAFERLRDQGKILRWGVSNFDLGDMYELDGSACAANQVMYNLEERGIEYDLLPWCQERGMPVMAYCPVGQGGRLLRHPALGEIAARHDASSAQVALAWLLEQGVIAIPKAVTSAHIRQNAAAADLELSADDLRALDQAFPPPTRKRNLAIV
ncbi:aldo/keto reductase [Pseudomonas aeruginosa]